MSNSLLVPVYSGNIELKLKFRNKKFQYCHNFETYSISNFIGVLSRPKEKWSYAINEQVMKIAHQEFEDDDDDGYEYQVLHHHQHHHHRSIFWHHDFYWGEATAPPSTIIV